MSVFTDSVTISAGEALPADKARELIIAGKAPEYMRVKGLLQRNEYHSYPIIRFELEVEEGGKTRRASTELIDYGKVDYKNYPPGTEVRAKYDPQTGSIAMLDSKGRVLEKL